MAEMVTALDELFTQTHPGSRFALSLKGTRFAPDALAAGTTAFAPMGAEFSPEQLTHYRNVVGSDPISFRVAHASLSPRALSGPLAIVVHKSNPLTRLTLVQVARIFAPLGQPVTTWNDVGVRGPWAKRSIQPAGLKPDAALALFMREHIFNDRPFVAGYVGFGQSADVVARVGQDPTAIGFAALNRATSDVKVIAIAATAAGPYLRGTEADIESGRYPLDRFLYIYARQSSDQLVAAYLALALSDQGQAAIAAGTLGYLPLNAAEIAAERAKLANLPTP